MYEVLYPKLYRNFFPKWRGYWEHILPQYCSKQLRLYQTQPVGSTAHVFNCIETAHCMMKHYPTEVESQTASTAVLLGMIPSVLSILGSSPVELSLLSTRRPMLSLLLVLGAPVVNPIRLFDYINPEAILKSSSESANTEGKNRIPPRIVALLQHLFAFGAAANIAIIAFELNTKAYSVIAACRGSFMIYAWTFSVIILYGLGLVAFGSRSRYESSHDEIPPTSQSGKQLHLRLRAALGHWADHEFSTCSQHERRIFHWRKENNTYLFTTQALAVGTISHIFYGSALLAGYQFVAPIDALSLIGRWATSAWISRLILKLELSGMSVQTVVAGANSDEDLAADQSYVNY